MSPTLSVIVPVYNAPAELQRCLAALAASRYEHFDVLVIDDGSTVSVAAVVAAYGFRSLRLDGPGGPARARNYGATQVTGPYVVFIDADVCVHQDTLERFAAAFTADQTLDAVIGAYDETPAAPNFLSQYKNLFHAYTHQRNDGPISTFWSGCGAIRRELFLAYGGFDAQRYPRPAIEDIELGMRLWTAGHRIVLDRHITATHLKRWTLWRLLKTDIFDRGIPWVRLMWRLGAVANTLNVTPGQRLSVALVYLLGLMVLLTAWWPEGWSGIVALAAGVTTVNHDFYRFLAARRGVWFALRAVPWHWLYFGYCGFCVAWGTLLHILAKDPRSARGDIHGAHCPAASDAPSRSSHTGEMRKS
jgi:cellulose synthase/poly-beta-1,6-N-acetylglucosamine synthase-like glycosyltransferase